MPASPKALLEEAIKTCQAEYPMPAGAFMGSLALIEAKEGHLARARALLREGSERLQEDNKEELAKLICKRGLVEQEAGEEGLAREALAGAMTIAQEIRAGQSSDLGTYLERLQRVLARG